MSAGWVAGSVRAVGLSDRRLGAARARVLATTGSLTAAQRMLADSPYRRGIRIGSTLADTEHAVAAQTLWQLRVLAGWQPGTGARAIRILAGGFEIANICALAAALSGAPRQPLFELGALATVWSRVRDVASTAELRAALRNSPWGDPGGETADDIAVGTALGWACRTAAEVTGAAGWAAGAAALLTARHRLCEGRVLREPVRRRVVRLLGPATVASDSLPEFAAALPRSARWALSGIDSIGDLWRAEFGWWSRVERDGQELLHHHGFGTLPVVGAVAVLAADAWRVRAALQIATNQGAGMEAYDELV
jgi:hypothetical protein